MNLRTILLFSATIACLASCSDKSPLSPTNPAAGETVYTVPTSPGTPPITFSFNYARLTPRRGGQLVTGAEVIVTVRCNKPNGWEMIARLRGSSGPRTAGIAVPMFDTRGGRDPNQNLRTENFTVGSCADHDQGTAYTITAQEPDIPFIRLEVWTHPSGPNRPWGPGNEPGLGWLVGPSGAPQAPHLVVDERVDWRRP
jgi:hypothetical protein